MLHMLTVNASGSGASDLINHLGASTSCLETELNKDVALKHVCKEICFCSSRDRGVSRAGCWLVN